MDKITRAQARELAELEFNSAIRNERVGYLYLLYALGVPTL